jgi:MAF protein
MPDIVLASSSIYRAKLLKQLHLEFESVASNIDESRLPNETPAALALRLSEAKARAVNDQFQHHLIIGSDQVACCGEAILGKPGNRASAIEQLSQQSGQVVHFYTGISVLDSKSGKCLNDVDICSVHFRPLDRQQILRYLDVEQPYDCAGSFKSEAYGIVLFDKIVGEDPNALIGLPLIKLIALLAQFGIVLP